MSGPEIRPATEADLDDFYGHRPAQTVRALVAMLDDRPIGITGIAYPRGGSAEPYLFSDWTPELRRRPKTLVKGARSMLRNFAVPGLRAVAAPDEPGAPRLLRRLGFISSGRNAVGEIFTYRGDC
jgi:hypothetical protein